MTERDSCRYITVLFPIGRFYAKINTIIFFQRAKADGWEAGVELFIETLKEHLEKNPESILHGYKYIAAGFVDGDLEIVKSE